MEIATVGEISLRASRIIRNIRENGTPYIITRHRRPVALLSPIKAQKASRYYPRSTSLIRELEQLGKEVGFHASTKVDQSTSPLQDQGIANYDKVTVDATVFLNAIVQNGDKHRECRRLFEYFQKEAVPIICPMIILVEIQCLMKQQQLQPGILKKIFLTLGQVSQLVLCEIDLSLMDDTVAAADFSYPHINDVIYRVVASRYSTTLITMNPQLRERGGADYVSRYPTEALEELEIV